MIELVVAIGALLVGLNGVTFAYVLRIERRLTRLETVDELRDAPRRGYR